MANKDGIVSIGFDYKKELDGVCATIEKELNNLGGDINLSDGIKKQMTEIKKMITDMKKDIGSSFDKITETKLDTKTFESFKKDVNKRIREVSKEVTILKEQFSALDGSANVNGIVQQFANLKKYVEDSNTSISELISNSKKLGQSIKLKNEPSNSKENVNDIKKQIDSLERSLNVLDGNGMTSYKNKSVEKLKEDIIELVTSFDNVQNKYEVLSETLKNTDKSSPLFISLEKQATEYELKLAEILTRIETIRNEIDNKGLEKYEKQLEDYNNRKIVKTKSDGSVEYAKEPNYPTPIDLSDIIPLDIDEKIDSLIDNGFESGVSKAKALLSELKTDLNSISNKPEKTELNGVSNNIELHISTKQSTINKQLDEMIDNLQQRAANKPIIAPVKLRVDSEYEKTTKDASASALTENQINEARKDVESVVPGLEKAFNNSMRIATNKAVEIAKESIKTVREFFESNPITVHLTVPDDEKAKIGKAILSEDGKTTVNISGEVDKARKSVKGLSEDLEKSQLLIKENAQNAKNLSLEKLVNSLSETMSQFSELKGIISSIQNMENTIARASGISSTNELIEQWSIVEKTIINATKLDGDFRKNANIGKIISEYQKYIDMGGTNSLFGIDKIKDNETTINSILSKMKELKSQDVENDSIQKLSVDLDGVIAKFDELISTVKTATNALYKIIKQGSVSDLDKQWSSISNKFKSIADETGKINLSKQKTDIKELMDMYQKYTNAGGTNSLMSLTDNVETLRKLDKEYQKLNQTQTVDNSSTIEKESESFKNVEKSVDSLTTAIGDTKVQAINIEATAMEDAAEREIMAIRSILDNLDLIVSRLKDIKGIKLPKIEVKNVDVVEKAVESLANAGNKSNISSENSIVETQNKIQEELKETQKQAEQTQEALIEVYRGVQVKGTNGVTNRQYNDSIWSDAAVTFASSSPDVAALYQIIRDQFSEQEIKLGDGEILKEVISLQNALSLDNGGKTFEEITYWGDATDEAGKKAKSTYESLLQILKELQDTYGVLITENAQLYEDNWGNSKYSFSQNGEGFGFSNAKELAEGLSEEKALIPNFVELIQRYMDAKMSLDSQLETNPMFGKHHIEDFAKMAQQAGYSVVEIKNVIDTFDQLPQDLATDYIIIDPSAIKSVEQYTGALSELTQERLKLAEQGKETNITEVSKIPIEDVFQGDEASKINEIADATNNLADAENRLNIVEDKKTAQKYWQGRFKDSVADITKTNDELLAMRQYYSELEKLNDKITSAQNKVDNANIDIGKLSKRDVQSDDYVKAVENYRIAIDELQNHITYLNNNGIQSQDDINELNRLQSAVDEISKSIKNMSAPEKGTSLAKSSTVFLKIEELRDKYKGMSKDMQNELDKLERKFREAGNSLDTSKAIGELKQFETQLIKTGTATNSLWSAMKNKAFYNFANQLGTMVSFYDIINLGRQGFQTIRELDTALVDLKKTTAMNSSQLEEFYFDSNDVAKQMGVTTAEIINQASAWSRLGYSTKEASIQMAELSAQFAAISPDLDLDSATDGLVSSMKAFDIEVSNVERDIMDNINRIGNTAATSNGEIVDMLTRSSAAMAAANNTIQETIALETAAVEITRNAETTGTAFKTLSMRIRGYDEETEELSDDLKNISGDIADLTKTASTPSGISLFTDETKQTYKSTYQILKEISDIYDELSDKNRAELLEKLAGKRGGQVVAGLLSNFDAAEKALREMEGAAGSADAEMSIVEESIDFKLNALKETLVGTAQALLDRGDLGKIIDGLTKLSEAIGWVVDKAGLLGTLAMGGGLFAGIKNIGRPKMFGLIV